MKKITLYSRLGAVLVAGAVMVAAPHGNVKKTHLFSDDSSLKSTSIEDFLENESIRDLTTIDEEIASGDLDIVEKDNTFRKKVMDLEYYESASDMKGYNSTLDWLHDNFEDTTVDILLTSAKGGIAEEEDKTTRDIKLTPAPDFDEDRLLKSTGVAEIKNSNGYSTTGYTIKSDLINEAVEEAARIQTNNYNEYGVEELLEEYDKAVELAKMTIASGASRHDDEIVEKNSKRYIKKNLF